MKKYITTEDAVKHCEEEGTVIPSAFLSTFPNNFGINLCAVKGFEVDMTDDDQYKSIRVDFEPVEHRTFNEDNR
jgi:hypothetical protein